MKTKHLRHSVGGVILGIFLLALGCSDGELPGQGPDLGESPQLASPVCKNLTADPTEIDRGGSTTLSWEVELADKVAIAASGDNAFRFETTEQFTGSTVVSDIQQTTVFILTASNSSIAAETEAAQEGEEGEEAPAGIQLSLSKADEEEDEEGKEGAEEEDTAPAPQLCRSNVTVEVKSPAAALVIEHYEAEKTELSPNEQTVLHWQVMPEEALVTFASSSGDLPVLLGEDCAINGNLTQIEQEVGEVPVTYPASGCASVGPISVDTTYTLTATWGDQTQSKDVTVALLEGEEPEGPEEPEVPVLQVDCSDIRVTAPVSPVFSGEEVKIIWNISGLTASAIASVRIADGKGRMLEEVDLADGADHAEVEAKASGFILEFLTADGNAACSKTASVPVASFDRVSTDPRKAVKVVKDAGTDVYVGLDYGEFNEGKIKLWHSDEGEMPIDFFTTLKTFDEFTGQLTAHFMNDDIKTFPVSGVAKGSDGTLFVATTGGIIYKKAEGDWKPLTSMLLWGDSGQEGTHASCFGKEQTGRTSRTRNDIVSMSQFCDLEVAGSKLYAATDKGLFWLDDVGSFIDGEGRWQGVENNPTDTHVVNDVLVDGSDVYAATSVGVFKNGALVLDGVYANSVAVSADGDSQRVVVGADNGVYMDGELKLESNIYSVADDPYDQRTFYAAGASGFYVSRDGGESFTQVTVEGVEGELRSVAVLYSANPRETEANYYVYLAGDSGIYKVFLDDVVMGEVVGPTEPTEGTEEETPPPAEEVEGVGDDFHVEGSASQP